MLSFPFPIIIVTSSSTTITIFTNHHLILLLLWHYKHYCQHLSNNVLCVYVQNDIKIKRGSLLIWLSTTKTIATHIIFTWGEKWKHNRFRFLCAQHNKHKKKHYTDVQKKSFKKTTAAENLYYCRYCLFSFTQLFFYHKKINYEETNTKKLSEREREEESKRATLMFFLLGLLTNDNRSRGLFFHKKRKDDGGPLEELMQCIIIIFIFFRIPFSTSIPILFFVVCNIPCI